MYIDQIDGKMLSLHKESSLLRFSAIERKVFNVSDLIQRQATATIILN